MENEENSKFCRGCGEKINRLNNINNVNDRDSNKNEDENQKKILIGVAIILVIAIVAVGAYAITTISDDSDDDSLFDNSNDNSNNIGNNIDTSNSASVTTSSIPLSEVYDLAIELSIDPDASSVQYNGVTFTKQQCLYIFAKAIDMKNKGVDGNINYKSYGLPDSPLNSVSTSYLTKSEYVDMAQRTYKWMDNHGKAPNYTGIVSAGSPDFGYEGLVSAYAIVIIRSKNGSLPATISW